MTKPDIPVPIAVLAMELTEFLRVRCNSVPMASEVLLHTLCPLVVADSVSVDHAQHTLHTLIDEWFTTWRADAARWFKPVQPKAM